MKQAGLQTRLVMHLPESLILSRKHFLAVSYIHEGSFFKMDFEVADVTMKRSTEDNPCQENHSIQN